MLGPRDIPKVDKVLAWPEVKELCVAHPRSAVVRAVREVLAGIRQKILEGGEVDLPVEGTVTELVKARLLLSVTGSLRRVINGTGIVIHTNLGRSPLPEGVMRNVVEVSLGYSNLEFDLEEGGRGSRSDHVEKLLCELIGAEAALVVNNNAAAVLLALAALASGKEVVVSRGELVEIGGAFRIPDVMRQSGAYLREVGTTNRTHPADYREAIGSDTALLLKVHRSNFELVGFTAEVGPAELVAVGREHALPVMVDAGSGNLVHLPGLTSAREPTVGEYLAAGADLVTFSGDKLLGGPQAGIIAGSVAVVRKLKKHPLLRALRIDKMTLAALEATLRLYRDERQALLSVPTLNMLTLGKDQLLRRGRLLLRKLRGKAAPELKFSLAVGVSQVGGGALPLAELETVLLVVSLPHLSAHDIERRLRVGPVPVVGRITRGDYVLDLRTILPRDEDVLVAALLALAP